MLNFMRVHMGKTFLTLIVLGIGVVFVFLGVFPGAGGMGGGLAGTEVASVGGEKITARDLKMAIDREMQSYRAMGVDLPDELRDRIKQGSLNSLINQKLMLVEAEHLGITATKAEVMDEIQKMPYFLDKDNKAFSVDLYKKVLAENNLSPGLFEEEVRQNLTNQRMLKFLQDRIRVTPSEVKREYEVSNTQRNLLFVRLTREDAMKKMSVTKEEVSAFIADPAKQALINSYYTQNTNRFNRDATVCARHILKRTDRPKEGNSNVKDLENPPKAFLDLHPTPANFAKIATQSSDDSGTKPKGGDLGCFPKGMMDKAFEEVAFNLPANKISKPVKSAFGWHYILVYKKVPALNRPLESVKTEIVEELIKRDRIEELRKINLAEAEKLKKSWPAKSVEETGLFNGLEGMIPKIGRADEILKAAFDPKADVQKGPQIFEAQGAVIVASVKARKSPDLKDFEKEKEVHQQTLRERKMRAFLPAWIEDVQSRVKVSYNPKAISML